MHGEVAAQGGGHDRDGEERASFLEPEGRPRELMWGYNALQLELMSLRKYMQNILGVFQELLLTGHLPVCIALN